MNVRARGTHAIPIALFVLLAGCDGRSPSPTSPTSSSFLTGTWTGTITFQVNPGDPDAPPPTTGPITWTFAVVPQTDLRTFKTTIRSQDPWLTIETTASTALTPDNSPPTSISTQGEYNSPRGCRGTFASIGTAQATRIEADFNGSDCQLATFSGTVVLTKQ
ncbi:MAG: hypothetical protein ABS36_05140 [Acidobacteria bacterium SCN 69-37]|nr:MAG: hypothetical protein ABS36_05140 [Acidobacteria bacterium SCN 69-37]